jgi:hypothetical protein
MWAYSYQPAGLVAYIGLDPQPYESGRSGRNLLWARTYGKCFDSKPSRQYNLRIKICSFSFRNGTRHDPTSTRLGYYLYQRRCP